MAIELTGLDSELVDAQIRAWSSFSTDERKRAAADRRKILDQDFSDLVLNQIASTHYDVNIRNRIGRFVSLSLNAGADITNALAVVYKQGASRILLKSSKKAQKAFDALYEESRMDTLAPRINRLAFMVGPVLEVPCVRGGRLCRDIFPADQFDIALQDDDPLGQPDKAAYSWYEKGKGQVVVLLDRFSFRFYEKNKREPYKIVPHGVVGPDGQPAFPGTVWRLEHPTSPFDWWLINRNRRLVDATVEIAFWYTVMNWVRKTQNRYVVSFFGNTEKAPKGQTVDPELPWVVDVDDQDATPQFNVQNAQVDPGMFIKHIMFVYTNVIEAYGVPQSTVNFDVQGEGGGLPAMRLSHERLAQLRREQIPYMREAEHSSAWKAVAVAKLMGHPHAEDLPDPKRVRESFSLQLPEINRVDDPSIAMDVLDWELKKGLISPVDLMLYRHSDLTPDEAQALQDSKLENFARFNEFLTARNLSLDPNVGAAGTAETFGRTGPMVRDAKKDEPEEEQDE